MLFGSSIQIDPLFPYYQQRSAHSIAEEIELQGYGSVHYFIVNENIVNRELITAFQNRGIKVWAMVIGNGTFSTEHFPEEWSTWQMELLVDTHDHFWRLSPFSRGYVRWKKSAMVKLVTDFPFDGIEIAEPYFPEWGGIQRGVYGDVGPLAQHAFRKRYGLEMPDFRNPESPTYYLKVPSIYQRWIEFRIEAVNGFIDEMINGKDGVRQARPDILVATWSLAVNAPPYAMERLREDQGLDAPSMIGKVRPDMHYLQTHWPDWGRSDLPADYVKSYQPFIDSIRQQFPNLPLAVQADIGSGRNMIKNRQWLDGFIRTAKQLGFSSWTAYEYHIGGYMYETLPIPVLVSRPSSSEIIISFNKRIDEHSAAAESNYSVWKSGRPIDWNPLTIESDGNRIILRSEQFPEGTFEMRFSGIKDTPDRWLYKDFQANKIPTGTMITIPGASL